MNKLAEVFPPGDFLKEELQERGLTQAQLAFILGRPLKLVNEIINGKKQITAQTALQLERALGIPARSWLNLESMYQLSKVREVDEAIAERAAAYA